MSLSSTQSKPHQGKENQRKSLQAPSVHSEPNTTSNHHHPVGTARDTAFPSIKEQFPPPPGLGPPVHVPTSVPSPSTSDATSNGGMDEWPDLAAGKGKPLVSLTAPHLPASSQAPPSAPPPGFQILNQPPRYYASYTASSQNTANSHPIVPPTGNIIQTAKILLNNGRDYAEFRRLSGLYAKGSISVKSYHKSCTGLFGGAVWQDIGPKLAQTLPNPDKQQELLGLFHNQSWGRPTPAYSQVTSAVAGRQRGRKQKGTWQLAGAVPSGSKSCQLSEEEYPSLSASSKQPDPAIFLPGWSMKVSVK